MRNIGRRSTGSSAICGTETSATMSASDSPRRLATGTDTDHQSFERGTMSGLCNQQFNSCAKTKKGNSP